ncbi:MAG TPA: BTAD domain-containing putative transcriptional regulator, partial [Acidimicrobiia bacterium]
MRFAVLGPVTVGDGEQSQQLRGPRQRAVLALLLSDPARAVTADRMVTEIWGEGAGTGAVDSLYTHVSTLRRLLGKDRIDRDSSGYRLVLRDGDEIDAQVFEREVGEARRVAVADAAGAVEMFDTALSRWRGRPYEGLEDVPSLAAEISRLEGIHAAAEMDRIEALLQSGATPAAVEVEAICDRRPLDERPWSLLMRSLYRDGRQADALRTCTRVRELLGRELGIEPSPLLTGLEEQILLHDPALDAGTFDAPASLPSHLTSFVGRTDEQQHLAELLLDHRLITITGPGGVGKTRLGVELASASRARFPDGVWHVDLASCSDPTQIGSTIGAAVHIPGAAAADTLEHVAAALATKSVLVVLDNCEHLRQAAADVVETLLSRAPGLTILATSRRPLKIAGEQRYALEGLPVGTDEETIGDAERLFIERCSEIEPTQGGGDRPLRAIRAICEHLDGLPLALELAAGRSDVLSPPEISALLSRRFAILVDERQPRDIHRSLEATVGWSYGLLDPDERSAYAALGVFEGPFTIDAAAAVLGVDDVGDAVSRLERLVTASLVTVASGESDRTTFRLLETLRAYARDRLRESGRWPEAVGRHDEHYLAVCAGLREEFLGAGRVAATDRIAQELVDFLAVWDRGMLDDPTSVLPLAWPLGNYWLFGGRLG